MEKIFLVAKNIAICSGKLRKFCIKTKVSFWPLFSTQSLHSYPAKMSIFIASKNIIFHFYGIKSLGKNDKIFIKQSYRPALHLYQNK